MSFSFKSSPQLFLHHRFLKRPETLNCNSKMRRMKKVLGLMLLIVAFTIAGCGKDDDCPTVNVTAPAAEVAALKAYLDANNINATADARGFFYTITTPGSGSKPSACDKVIVGYVGQRTDGKIIDRSNSTGFSLSGVILGWQEGVPLIGAGGSIVLYLPPSLAYGSRTDIPDIPANSNLIFTIDLKGIN